MFARQHYAEGHFEKSHCAECHSEKGIMPWVFLCYLPSG
jgi:hypothetical protein